MVAASRRADQMTRPGVYRLVSTALWDANPVSAQSTKTQARDQARAVGKVIARTGARLGAPPKMNMRRGTTTHPLASS